MPKFTPDKPVVTRKPAVEVDPGLAPGRHRFHLILEDEAGNRSRPAEIVITVGERPRNKGAGRGGRRHSRGGGRHEGDQ